MTSFTLCAARSCGNANNNHYPNHHQITDEAGLKQVARLDHVAATYTNDRRFSASFIASDCVVMGIDNDHTDEHATLLEKYHRLLDQISDLDNRQTAYHHYREELDKLDADQIEFTPSLWHTLVDHAEIGTDGTITRSRSRTEGRRRSHSTSDRLSNSCDIVYRILGAGVHGDFPVVRVCDVQRREWGFTESNNKEPVC